MAESPLPDRLRAQHRDAVLRAILNAAFDAIVTMDADGLIVDVNPAAEAMFGASAETLRGQELAEAIVPPSLREAHRQGVRNYIATGAERVSGHPVHLTAMRADGGEFPVEVAIRRLEVGGPPVFTGFIRDLTARHAAEAEAAVLAQEQAALRRVATLVARGTDHATLFAAITQEVAGLLDAETANMIRYQGDGTEVVIGAYSKEGARNFPLGSVLPLDGDSAGPRILRTHAPVREDEFVPSAGRLGAALAELGFKAAVGAPVDLDGELWGAVIARSNDSPFPPGAEYRLQAFAELAAQAIANAEAREQLAASRARIVTAGSPSGAGSSATCTTARSSAWSPSPCACGSPASSWRPAGAGGPRARGGGRSSGRRSPSCARSPAACTRRSSPTTGWRPPSNPSAAARPCPWTSASSSSAIPARRSRPPPTTSSPRR